MVRAHLSVTTIRQLIEMKMSTCSGVHRSLACLHRAVGENVFHSFSVFFKWVIGELVSEYSSRWMYSWTWPWLCSWCAIKIHLGNYSDWCSFRKLPYSLRRLCYLHQVLLVCSSKACWETSGEFSGKLDQRPEQTCHKPVHCSIVSY